MTRSTWIGLLSLCIVALGGCDGEQESAQTEIGDKEVLRLDGGPKEDAESSNGDTDIFGDRILTRAGRAILVPATSLFPGSAVVDPGIDNPYAGDPQAIAAGERHFNAFNCSGCHAPSGGGGMGPPLSDDEWIYGGEPAQIYLSIMHGRPDGMPAWGAMLPKKTVWEMVAYIKNLPKIDNYAARHGFDENTGGFEEPADAAKHDENRPASD